MVDMQPKKPLSIAMTATEPGYVVTIGNASSWSERRCSSRRDAQRKALHALRNGAAFGDEARITHNGTTCDAWKLVRSARGFKFCQRVVGM